MEECNCTLSPVILFAMITLVIVIGGIVISIGIYTYNMSKHHSPLINDIEKLIGIIEGSIEEAFELSKDGSKTIVEIFKLLAVVARIAVKGGEISDKALKDFG